MSFRLFFVAALLCLSLAQAVSIKTEDCGELPVLHEVLRLPAGFDIDGLNNLIQQAFRGSNVRTAVWVPEPNLLETEVDDFDKVDKCCKCVNKTAQCIVKAACDQVKKHCEKAKSRYEKDKCKYMKAHKDVALGMIQASFMTHSHAYAYCVGTKDCKWNKTATLEGVFEDQQMALELESSLMFQFAPTLEDLDYSRLSQGGFSPKPVPEPDIAGEVCYNCIQFLSHEVLHHVVEAVKEHCEHTKDKGHQKWCKWAEKNPGVALGHIIVLARPEEWACGYCHGKGVCGKGPQAF